MKIFSLTKHRVKNVALVAMSTFAMFLPMQAASAQDVLRTSFPTNTKWELLRSTDGFHATDYYIGQVELRSRRERSYSYILKTVPQTSRNPFVYFNDNNVIYCDENPDNVVFEYLLFTQVAKRPGYYTNALLRRYREGGDHRSRTHTDHDRRVMYRIFERNSVSYGLGNSLAQNIAYNHICR